MYVYGISVSGVFDDKSEGCVGEKVRVLAMGSITLYCKSFLAFVSRIKEIYRI